MRLNARQSEDLWEANEAINDGYPSFNYWLNYWHICMSNFMSNTLLIPKQALLHPMSGSNSGSDFRDDAPRYDDGWTGDSMSFR